MSEGFPFRPAAPSTPPRPQTDEGRAPPSMLTFNEPPPPPHGDGTAKKKKRARRGPRQEDSKED